jgi:hypothetical protein
MRRLGRWIAPAVAGVLALVPAATARTDGPAWEYLTRAVAPASGVICQVPGAPLPLGGADAQTAAWGAWAFDTRGQTGQAGRALAVFLSKVQLEPRPRVPAGLAPALLTADGRPALPWAVRDIDGTAWLITACQQHLRYLDGLAREGFARDCWPAVQAGADLLADWSQGPNGPMLPSFQWSLGREGRSLESQVLALAALEAAMEIAPQAADTPNPDWQARADELLARLLLQAQGDTPLPLDAWVAAWVRAGLLENAPPRVARLNQVLVDTGGGGMPWQRVPVPAPPNAAAPGNAREAAAVLIAGAP